ncbi:hypothetical protein [Spirosoma pollinicola]|uniref:Uncharacterized protein n=1 Tax=Spirosoma pollinicola TaxID=2057025 RepID=A0A2K8Z9F6_9BACT|nr:hypothetical protein [Spirosoma pollinicola]AUD06502.1 hypothetical protein CWM47_34445 [Spirosoma pollinicola]
MKAPLISFIVIMTLAPACREEFHPLAPPINQSVSGSTCKAPLLKQNIVGQWSFQTNIGVQGISMPMREGVITFSPDGSIIDPDSLFENRLDIGVVVSKKYGVDIMDSTIFPELGYAYPELKQYGPMLWIRQSVRTQSLGVRFAQGWYFKEVSNNCKRIEVKNPSQKYGDIILTKK